MYLPIVSEAMYHLWSLELVLYNILGVVVGAFCRLNEVLDFAGPVSLVEVVDVYGFN